MRQENAVQILRLALAMRGSIAGVSLDDIREMFGVTERTAHRLRNAVVELFPSAEAVIGPDQKRYWRLPRGTADRLVEFSPEELAALDTARRALRNNNHGETADLVGQAAQKLRSLIAPDMARRLEPDVEALVEAEGVALRPGPRPAYDRSVLQALRQGIKACLLVEVSYRYRRQDRVSKLALQPYGLLLGSRHYLIAHRPGQSDGAFLRLYSLPDIQGAELTATAFERDPGISITDFCERSFGIFQEEPRRVVWRFSPSASKDAATFRFHPTQQARELPDGRLEVEFHAGGLLEMCWHLFTWGRHVEVVEPAALRDLYDKCLESGGWPEMTGDYGEQLGLFDTLASSASGPSPTD